MRYTIGALALGLLALLGPATAGVADEEPPAEETPGEEGPQDPRLAEADRLDAQLGDLYHEGRMAEGVVVARRSLAIREEVQGPRHRATAASRNNLGLLLQATGDVEGARACYEQALEVLEAVAGPTDIDTAITLDNLGTLLGRQGDLQAARPYLERAVAGYAAALGPEDPETATALHALGEVLLGLGDLQGARARHEQALAIRETAFGPAAPETARSLYALGYVLQEAGDLVGARAVFERTLRIREAANGSDDVLTANVLNNLGAALEGLGDLAGARRCVERALAIYEARYGPEHATTAACLANLGALLRALGDFAAARAAFERAIAIDERVYGPKTAETALHLNNLGTALSDLGETAAALAAYERALSIQQEVLGPRDPVAAATLLNIAGNLEDQGRIGEARARYEQALAIWEETLGPKHRYTAQALRNLGNLLLAVGDLEGARPLLERALVAREEVLGPGHPDTVRARMDLAVLAIEDGRDVVTARADLAHAIEDVAAWVRQALPAAEPSRRPALASSLRGPLDRWVGLSQGWPASSYGPVLHFKGLVARALAAERRLALEAPADVRAKVDRLRALGQRTAHLANQVPMGAERRARWREAYAAARAEQEAVALDLAASFAPLRVERELASVTVADVQAGLAQDEVLVDVIASAGEYVAWVVPPAGSTMRVDLGPVATVDDEVRALLAAVAEDGEADAWEAPAARLGAQVLAPLRPHLPAALRRLLVCPDAGLAAVPWALLPDAEGRPLLGSLEVVALPFATDLVRSADAGSATGQGALALGAVDYRRASAERTLPAGPAPTLALVRSAPRGGRSFVPLPGSAAEVSVLADRFGERALVLEGAGATEAALRAGVVGRRLVHLATHGFWRDDLPSALRPRADDAERLTPAEERQLAGWDPMLLAGLALAGANERAGGGDDDGILTAHEASFLDLRGCELVVLSACDTARGVSVPGEGVLGLVQAFRAAGARQTVASLWPVDDEATKLLMQRFYALWLDEERHPPAATALREAALWLRDEAKGEQGRTFEHPRFWAAFVAYGR